MRKRLFSKLLVISVVCFLSACEGKWWNNVPGMGGYWWTRGQVRSPQNQLTLAESRLADSIAANGSARKDVTGDMATITKGLDGAVADVSSGKPADQIVTQLRELESNYLVIEGKLSMGSRPAFAELASQLRSMTAAYATGGNVLPEAVELYSARTKMLFASELAMAAPVLQN